jgi:hypothetical protein
VSTLIYVVLLMVGAPLLLWWVGTRRLFAVLRAGEGRDPLGDLAERHDLSRGQARRVVAEARRGERLDDPRLRRAAVDWASSHLEDEGFPAAAPTRTHQVMRALLAVWVACILGWLGYLVGSGQPERVSWPLLSVWVLIAVLVVRRRRGMRRAIEVNAETADA